MRSLLFVPGNSNKKLEKALDSGADALIIDLEDSVSAQEKSAARKTTATFLNGLDRRGQRPLLFVRVNDLSVGSIDADLAQLPPDQFDAIMLPKVEGAPHIRALSERLDAFETENAVVAGGIKILAIATETARGLLAMSSIPGSSDRLLGIAWGAEDLSADLGAETNRDGDGNYAAPYLYARSMTLVVAAAAEVGAIDAVYTNFRDLAGFSGGMPCGAAGWVLLQDGHPPCAGPGHQRGPVTI